MQVGYNVALRREGHRVIRRARSGDRVYSGRVVDKILIEPARLDFLDAEVPRELIDDRADHFKMPEFFYADVGQQRFQFGIRHHITLAQIPQTGAEFAVGANKCVR